MQHCLDACPRSLRSKALERNSLRTMLMMMKLCLAKDPRSRLEQSLTALKMLSPGRVCHMQPHAGYVAMVLSESDPVGTLDIPLVLGPTQWVRLAMLLTGPRPRGRTWPCPLCSAPDPEGTLGHAMFGDPTDLLPSTLHIPPGPLLAGLILCVRLSGHLV